MKWWKKLKSLLRRNKSNLQSENRNSHQDDLIEKEIYFPCNAFFRKIIEAVLEQKGISYRDMRLFVIDAEDGAYLRQEEEQYMLRQLYPGLNAYTLCTGQPECHRKEMDYLYEEMGLIVEVIGKEENAVQKGTGPEEGRLILDFEAEGRIREEFLSEKSIYISIYKRNWYQPGQPHKKYPSWNKNSLMDIFKWFLQFSEKSIPAHTLNDRYTAYSFFYKSFSSFYQIVYPISLGYNKSF